MSEIRTRTFNYGDEKEDSWPPRFPRKDAAGFHGYWDSETQTFKEGRPPQRNIKHGIAPYIITDSMDEYYHPAACTGVDSKSKLKMLDEIHGTITTDKKLPTNTSPLKQREKERRDDMHKCIHRAVAQLDAGTAPMTGEVKELCAKQNEIVSSALGFDAFNVAGRKNDKRGKRFRRKK